MVRAVGGLVILLVVMALQPSLFGSIALRKPARISCATERISSRTFCWANAVIVLPLATVFRSSS